MAALDYSFLSEPDPEEEAGSTGPLDYSFLSEPPKAVDKPLPEARAVEPTVWDSIQDFMTGGEKHRARASNELAARKIAKREGIDISDVYESAGGGRPMLNPEGRAQGRAPAEGAGIVGEQFWSTDIPKGVANTVLRTIRGGDETVDDTSFIDRSIKATDAEDDPNADQNYQSFQNLGKNLGYSLTTMVSGVTAFAAGSLASPVTGTVAAGAASAAVAFRGSKDEFLSRAKEGMDAYYEELHGRPMTQKEWDSAYDEYNSLANKYGAWEAIPEAIGNMVFIRAFALPLKGANLSKLRVFKEKANEIAGRTANTLATENITEIATALGQNRAELEAGMADRKLSMSGAIRETVIPTTLLTTIMGGAGGVAKGVGSIFKRKGENTPDQTPELFDQTHTAGGGQPVQVATKNGKIVPDTYVNAAGDVIRDSNAVPVSAEPVDLSMNVDAVAAAAQADIASGSQGIVGSAMDPYGQNVPVDLDTNLPTAPMPTDTRTTAERNQAEIDSVMPDLVGEATTEAPIEPTSTPTETTEAIIATKTDEGVTEAQVENSLVAKAREGDKESQEKLTNFGLGWDGNKKKYRIVGKAEADLIISGEKVESNRGHGTTDITDNPEYSSVSGDSNHRVTFKQTDRFDSDLGGEADARIKNDSKGEYHLANGYSIDDVQTIEERQPDGSWKVIHGEPADTIDPETGETFAQGEQRADNAARVAAKLEGRGIEVGTTKAPESPVAASEEVATPVVVDKKAIDAVANEAATSPQNDLTEPTDGQKEAGNYKKPPLDSKTIPWLAGMPIKIENPAGSKRNEAWPALKNHYGYFQSTEAFDNDEVDVFIGPDMSEKPEQIFVIDQVDPKTGKPDENKIILGVKSAEEAKQVYLDNYEKGWNGIGDIKTYEFDDFKTKLKSGHFKNSTPGRKLFNKEEALKQDLKSKKVGSKAEKPTDVASKPVKPVESNVVDLNAEGIGKPATAENVKAIEDQGADYVPQKTVKAYKLFTRRKGEPNILYPLFVDANNPVPMNEWTLAQMGETQNGKVKSKIGHLANRPGWHSSEYPHARHIGKKDKGKKKPNWRQGRQVWAEVEIPADIDWQTEADSRAEMTKAGTPLVRTAHIVGEIPAGGHYQYNTNPNSTSPWVISGALRVNRILSDAEVNEINATEDGTQDLPRKLDATGNIIFRKQDPYEGMKGKDISYPVQVESTGKVYTLTVDAGQTMSDIDSRIESLQELRKCI